MNAKITATALFAVFAALSSGAQAQEATFEPAPQFTLGRTATAAAPVAGKTREQVRAEAAAALRTGEVARINAEAADFRSPRVTAVQPVYATVAR